MSAVGILKLEAEDANRKFSDAPTESIAQYWAGKEQAFTRALALMESWEERQSQIGLFRVVLDIIDDLIARAKDSTVKSHLVMSESYLDQALQELSSK